MKLRRWLWYPVLMAQYPVLSLYAQNASSIPLLELVWPIALVTTTTTVVWLVLRFIVGDSAKAGLLTVLALCVFDTVAVAPGWVDEWLCALSWLWVARTVHVWPPIVVGAALVIAVGLAYLIARMKGAGAFTYPLNVFAFILVAIPVFTIAMSQARHWASATGARAGVGRPPGAFPTAHLAGHRPDIYYIIVDSYARADVMSELFGMDIEPFLKRLEEKGFYVARRSTSNYCQTALSLSSSLNSVYLQGWIAAETQNESLNRWTGDGSIVRTLRGLGYRFVTFATGFTDTDHPDADVYLSPFWDISPFHRLLLDQTPLSRLAPMPVLGDSYATSRARTRYLLEELPQVAQWGAPTFTFAHIIAPHPPFIFGEHGEDVSPHEQKYKLSDGEVFREWYGDVYVDGYRKQVAFVTDQVEGVIDRILASSPQPPLIILQSDHGSGLKLSTESIVDTDIHERMSILNAYFFPEPGGKLLYQSISPVNSFRVVLNTYFDARLELLPDRSYYSTWRDPFRFIDVTDKVRLPSEIGPASARTAQ